MIGLACHTGHAARCVRPRVMPQTDDAVFYQLYFQTPGVAEADLEADVRRTIRTHTVCQLGRRSAAHARAAVGARRHGAARRAAGAPTWRRCRRRRPRRRPGSPRRTWISTPAEFTRSGFRGGLNWYRNIDRNWELLAPFAGATVNVPGVICCR